MLNIVNSYYDEQLSNCYGKYQTEGMIRSSMGNLYQDICKRLILLADKNLIVKRNDFLIVPSKSGKFELKNVQVDNHVYKDNQLVLVVECKTYLDRCFLQRAISDFKLIRRKYPYLPCVILSGQTSVGKEAWNFFKEEYDFEAFIINQNKKRDSSQPIFKTQNKLDNEEMERFIEYVRIIADLTKESSNLTNYCL